MSFSRYIFKQDNGLNNFQRGKKNMAGRKRPSEKIIE